VNGSHVYIVKLDPDLLAVNARIRAAASRKRVAPAALEAVPPLSGTLHNGYNEATAQIAPGTSGTITVSFEFGVLSVSSSTFDLYRTQLQEVLSVGTEQGVATAAGITTQRPPAPASRMAGYVDVLFSDVVFHGAAVSGQSTAFGDDDCSTSACTKMLAAIRRLDVTQVDFSGTLTASSESPATAEVAAYIPITAVEFDDGLTIPFAGYSDNVVVDNGGLKRLAIPGGFWSEPAADSLGMGATGHDPIV
jgi:hypothetical protein